MTRAFRLVVAGFTIALLVCPLSIRTAAQSPRAAAQLQAYGEVTLRDLPSAHASAGLARAIAFRPTHPERFEEDKAEVGEGAAPGATATLAASAVAVSDSGFDGVDFADSGMVVPPDTQVAVGPNHIFEAVNDRVRIWSRQTSPPSVAFDTDLGSFFGVGFFTTLTDIVSDPRVRYDPSSDRWFVTCVTLETLLNQADWRIAVSKTNDPTGAYKLYAGTFTGTFPDFPSLGISDDKVAIAGNSYTISSQQFQGSEFIVNRKADLVAGVSAPAGTFFGPPQAVDSIQAAMSLSSTPTLYLAAVASDGQTSGLQVWAIDGVPGVGSGVAVTTTALTMQTTVVVPPDAVQPNSTVAIATNDARLLNLVYRNGSLWMGGSTGCTPAGDNAVRACLHYVAVDAASRTITQEITFGEPGIYYYYPATITDSSGNMVSTFTRSSASEFASVYVSGHGATDPAGTLQAPTLIRAGQAVYDPSGDGLPPRWGDYSGVADDPFDGDASIWIAAEYMRAEGGSNWGTWLAKVAGSTSCTPPATPGGVAATAGDSQVTVSWSPAAGAASYTVKRAAAHGGPYSAVASGITSTSYTDTGLSNGTTYFYVVSAQSGCGAGDSADSAEVSATPTAVSTVPLAPTNLAASGAKRKVNLTWTQSASAGVTQNKIYRATVSGGPYTNIATVTATTSYVDTAATSRTKYYYVVTAVRNGVESPYSNQASATAR